VGGVAVGGVVVGGAVVGRAAVGNRTVAAVAVAVVGELSLVEINGGTCLLSTEFLLHCGRHIDAEPRYVSQIKGGETSTTTSHV
jgi:hypothetical protein